MTPEPGSTHEEAVAKIRSELLTLSVMRPGKHISDAPSEPTLRALAHLDSLAAALTQAQQVEEAARRYLEAEDHKDRVAAHPSKGDFLKAHDAVLDRWRELKAALSPAPQADEGTG